MVSRSFEMRESPIVDPWPGSVDGAHALVEAYKALKLRGIINGTEVGGGGSPRPSGSTSPTPFPPTKSKRLDASGVIQ